MSHYAFNRSFQINLLMLLLSLSSCSTVIDLSLNTSDDGVGELIDFKLGELDAELGDSEATAGAFTAGEVTSGDLSAGAVTAGEFTAGNTCMPLLEICDGLDNDCDALIDEGTGAELCNGEDDDCDGQVDEDFLSLGQECSSGLGACIATGLIVCDSTNTNVYCNAQVSMPSDELCDDLDNDCDGQTDEGIMGCCTDGESQACGSNIGACVQGIQQCMDGEWGSCNGNPPSIEVCDGADNDCDGQTDEGVLNACGSCGVVPNETCNGQDDDCDGQVDEAVLNACGQCGTVPAEACNNQDDDCDGQIDEDFEELGSTCTIGQGACRSMGSFVCAQEGLTCNATVIQGSNETCNGQDDDCDGQIDETINFDQDSNNCGSCGNRCGVSSDRCIQGRCVCGPSRAICDPLSVCDGFSCCNRSEICFELP